MLKVCKMKQKWNLNLPMKATAAGLSKDLNNIRGNKNIPDYTNILDGENSLNQMKTTDFLW